MANFRISVYLFDANQPVAIDDVEVVADAMMAKYKGNYVTEEDHLRFMITASEIELPESVEEFIAAVGSDSFAILLPTVEE